MGKKKLVMQTMTGQKFIDHSVQYFRKRAYWLTQVELINSQGYRDVVEFEPDKKITLKEMLEIAKAEVAQLADDNMDDCGLRVYQLTRTR